MSWKNIKDHYRIGHQVQIRESRICIGSPYISDLIRITFDGQVSWGNLGPAHENAELMRYHAEMTADLPKLRAIIAAPDTFSDSITVYTYDGPHILKKQCDKLGWPNCTHDGLMMYENTFSTNMGQVIACAKRDANSGVKWAHEAVAEAEKDLAKRRARLAEEEADLLKLETDFPSCA